MKLIKLFTLLVATSAIPVANAEVVTSTNAIVFSDNSALNQQFVIKNTYDNIDGVGQLTIAAGDFTVTNQIGNAATSYSIDTSDCEGVHKKTQTCAVVINYTPSVTLDSQLIKFTDPNSSAVYPMYVTNYHAESDAVQVSRRLSPVIEDVKVFDSEGDELTNNQLTNLTTGNNDYTVEWTVLTYEPLKGQLYLYDCAIADDKGNVCAAKFDTASGKIHGGTDISGVTLTAQQVIDGGFDDYTFNGQTAIHQKFTGTMRIVSSDFNLDPVDLAEVHDLALRFVHKKESDSQRQITDRVTTTLSGNLNFVGQGDSGYFDTVGRALKLTGNEAPVVE